MPSGAVALPVAGRLARSHREITHVAEAVGASLVTRVHVVLSERLHGTVLSGMGKVGERKGTFATLVDGRVVVAAAKP